MRRAQFCKNIATLCQLERLKFDRTDSSFSIRTTYEIFTFDMDEEDVWLTSRQLRGTNKDDIEKINQFLPNPKPGKIIDVVKTHITINNDYEYAKQHYIKIKSECEERNMRCELKFDKIFIYTLAEEFYFKFNTEQILNESFTIMHRGYNSWSKMSSEYHKQPTKISTPINAVIYIHNHTKKKYGI